jgi:predicted ATPase
MKIKSFKVKNFKSLKEVNLELANLTLLTGVNSSGKSSFIQAMLLLKQNWNKLYISQIIKKPLSLNGAFVKLANKQDILFQEVYKEKIEFKILNDEGFKFYISFNNENLEFDTDYTLLPVAKTRYNLDRSFQYLQTSRMEPNVFYDLSEESINNDDIGIRGEFTAHYLAEKRHQKLNIEALKHEKSYTNQLLENVSLWLSEISKGIEVSTKVYNELDKVNLTYKYTYKESTTNDYTPLNVGYGLTYVLPVIVAILKSRVDDLIIIENPESHLHPAGQSKIAELCAIASQNGVQIIIETHSDHFFNGIRVAMKEKIISPEHSKVYYFRKNDNELETIVDTINIDENGNIDKYPKGFFDEWDNNLEKLLGL